MKPFFDGDAYTTPPDTRRFFIDRLPLGRYALYAKFAPIVFKARRSALSGTYDDEEWAKSSYNTMKIIEGCGGRFEITGFDTLRNLKEPVVFIANHIGTLETLALPVLIVQFRKATYVVKEKLVNGPIFGPVMRSRNPITVGRVDPRRDLEAVLTGGKELLESGYSIIIFPQSTRRDVFRRSQFNSLGIKLALHAGAGIVPVALKTDFWSNGKMHTGFGPVYRDRKIHFAFGPLMTPTGRGKSEHAAIIEFIESHLREWGGEIETPLEDA